MRAEEKLARAVRRALESLGITVSHVEVSHYRADMFGNHVARIQTGDGAIEAIFDRQYEIDLRDSRIAPARVPEIRCALAAEFRGAMEAGL